jgi:type IV secretory pathway TrbL component
MPFKSKSQMRGAFSGAFGKTMQNKAQQWAKETPSLKQLPERVSKTSAIQHAISRRLMNIRFKTRID